MERTRAELGANLKRVREERGVSRKELAESTGIAANMIADYENARKLPPVDKVLKLASALKVSIASLTGDTGYNNDFPNIPDTAQIIFGYRFERALQMAKDFLDSLLEPKIDTDGCITVYSPEKIKYNSTSDTKSYYGGYNAITFKNSSDFVKIMEQAEQRALHRRIDFNQAFREIVFVAPPQFE